jgi:hypothetical protein
VHSVPHDMRPGHVARGAIRHHDFTFDRPLVSNARSCGRWRPMLMRDGGARRCQPAVGDGLAVG